MKNSENEKTKCPFFVDVRDYLSSSMLVKKNQYNSIDQAKSTLFKDTVEKSERKPFDLFAHILEGQQGILVQKYTGNDNIFQDVIISYETDQLNKHLWVLVI